MEYKNCLYSFSILISLGRLRKREVNHNIIYIYFKNSLFSNIRPTNSRVFSNFLKLYYILYLRLFTLRVNKFYKNLIERLRNVLNSF